ncbi:alpha/beta fold hydrolase [Spinactinospora alkalitolerans]
MTTPDGIELDAVVHPPASGTSRGTVVQAHGITVDRDEGGMFVRLAERLAAQGFTAVRFSYRGHGLSGGEQRGATIAGEMLDLQSVIDRATEVAPGPVSLVAASFGAVSACLSLRLLRERVANLVLWNPVLDLEHTFLSPELPWGRENFGADGRRAVREQGYLLIDGEFRLGRVMWEEFHHYRPADAFAADGTRALVVHGDRDTYVSFDIAKAAALSRPDTAFHTIAGSDHGFDTPEFEDEAIATTTAWLAGSERARR